MSVGYYEWEPFQYTTYLKYTCIMFSSYPLHSQPTICDSLSLPLNSISGIIFTHLPTSYHFLSQPRHLFFWSSSSPLFLNIPSLYYCLYLFSPENIPDPSQSIVSNIVYTIESSYLLISYFIFYNYFTQMSDRYLNTAISAKLIVHSIVLSTA